ncbi:MAG: metabolite traffic protein EboE, partial [Gammaproteobacteria bacterium]|nr:metabolite traffic protein EboE [Gammaproteobacteria bacterium]
MSWSGSQLSYCSNVHPGETLAGVGSNIARYIAPVRQRRGLESMSAALWLCADVAAQLVHEPTALSAFRQLLDEHGLYLQTLNGFPYGGFHLTRVKEQVYQPDWSTPERLDYTTNLATIVAACLPPDNTVGSISTLPLGFAPGWTREQQQGALDNLLALATVLAELEASTGKHIRVCLEMEPGCVLERTAQCVELFNTWLPGRAQEQGVAADSVHKYLGLCYDVCHQAVMMEDISASLEAIVASGIIIGKIQVSSALSVSDVATPETRSWLGEFAEEKYLHQVCTRDANGDLAFRVDLAEALADTDYPVLGDWNIHFHVPVHCENLYLENIRTTRDAIEDMLAFLSRHPQCRP